MNSYNLKNLTHDDAMQYVIDKHQERMCELCELHILGCSHNTSTYQCEGCRCDSAIDYIMDELIENAEIEEEEHFNKYSPILIGGLK